jgi:enoyl-CoA hydratase
MSSVELDLRPSGPGGEVVALVTIRRPQRRNAIDLSACREMSRLLSRARAEGARALVLAGSEGSFCAGADLGTVQEPAFNPALRSLLEQLCDLPLVTIAAVEGPALGAGVQLAVACDLRTAAPSALFGVPAGRLGLMVDHWTVRRVALVAGQGPARALLLGDEQLDAEAALRLGLVQRRGGLDEALAWAADIAALAPLTLAGHKLALNRVENGPDDSLVQQARDRAWSSRDLQEGLAAFGERRRPLFEGR